MIKMTFILRIAFLLLILNGCTNDTDNESSITSQAVEKWNNSNYEILSGGSYNYTDTDIYEVFILPANKNDIKFAAQTHGGQAIRANQNHWENTTGGTSIAWDYRWSAPKKFKILWFRIVDMKKYLAAGKEYNKYTAKETIPGGAWCEGEITIRTPPIRNKASSLLLHFFPDGHVDGEINNSTEDASKVDIKTRSQLPRLNGIPCLKEASNPYFGQKKQIEIN